MVSFKLPINCFPECRVLHEVIPEGPAALPRPMLPLHVPVDGPQELDRHPDFEF
jgi:hypothetical protein